jgi:hypothetical protein
MTVMKKHDGRKLSPKTLEEIRIRAVERVQAGESPEKSVYGRWYNQARQATTQVVWDRLKSLLPGRLAI